MFSIFICEISQKQTFLSDHLIYKCGKIRFINLRDSEKASLAINWAEQKEQKKK